MLQGFPRSRKANTIVSTAEIFGDRWKRSDRVIGQQVLNQVSIAKIYGDRWKLWQFIGYPHVQLQGSQPLGLMVIVGNSVNSSQINSLGLSQLPEFMAIVENPTSSPRGVYWRDFNRLNLWRSLKTTREPGNLQRQSDFNCLNLWRSLETSQSCREFLRFDQKSQPPVFMAIVGNRPSAALKTLRVSNLKRQTLWRSLETGSNSRCYLWLCDLNRQTSWRSLETRIAS